MCSREKPDSKICLLVIAEFLYFAVNIIILPAVFCLCHVNVFNCGTLTDFLQLLPLPNTVPNLCIYITWAESLEASFQSFWKWVTGVEFMKLLLIKCLCVLAKFYSALTSVSFHVHFKMLFLFSCPSKWANIREDAWLGSGHSHHKKEDTTEGHFSVGESFSFGLVLLHWSNVLALKAWYIWSLGL